jgi:hypothetical protein
MIELSQRVCETLDLVYWKLKETKIEKTPQAKSVYYLPEDQRELLRKILLAINIQLDNTMIQLIEESKVIIKVKEIQLVFSDVAALDSASLINLASLGQMQQQPSYKKQTWLKLKKVFL